MKYLYMLSISALLTCPAHGQYAAPAPTNSVPVQGHYFPPPLTDTIAAIDAIPPTVPSQPPAAVIGPTNAIPRTSTGTGPEASSVSTIVEEGAGAAQGAAGPGSRSVKAAGTLVNRTLTPISTVTTVYDVGASLYRAAECERAGDQVKADRERAEARYDAMGLHPVIGIMQACADIIGNMTVGKDVVKDATVSFIAGNIQRERELKASLDFQAQNLTAAYERRNAAFQASRQANEQAAAQKAASIPAQAGASDSAYLNEMTLMLLPVAIAASQTATIKPPLAAPQPPHSSLNSVPVPSTQAGRSLPLQGPPLGSTFGSPPEQPVSVSPRKSGKRACSPFDRWWMGKEWDAKCK